MDARNGLSQTGGELQPRQTERVRGEEILRRARELRLLDKEFRAELGRLRNLIKAGKGEYNTRFYVRDDLWECWLYTEMTLSNILRKVEENGKK